MRKFVRLCISFALAALLAMGGEVSFAQKWRARHSTLDERRADDALKYEAMSAKRFTPVMDGVDPTMRYQGAQDARIAELEAEASDGKVVKRLIAKYLNAIEKIVSKKPLSKDGAAALVQQTNALNDLLISFLDEDLRPNKKGRAVYHLDSMEGIAEAILTLDTNITEEIISDKDYVRVLDTLTKRVASLTCHNLADCELLGAETVLLAKLSTPQLLKKYHVSDPTATVKRTKMIVKRLADRGTKGEASLILDQKLAPSVLAALEFLQDVKGMKDVIDVYVKKYGDKTRYVPTDPRDAFLVSLTNLALKYPFLNQKYGSQHLVLDWAKRNDNFLLELRGFIEIGRFQGRFGGKPYQYFPKETIDYARQYLRDKWCNLSAFNTGRAQDKMLIRRDIAWGYGQQASLTYQGDDTCYVTWPAEPFPQDYASDVLNDVAEAVEFVVSFVFPPAAVFTKPVQAVAKLYKSIKLANKTGKSLGEIYKMAKVAGKGGNQTRAQAEVTSRLKQGSRPADGSATNPASYNPDYALVPDVPAEGGFSPVGRGKGVPPQNGGSKKPWNRSDVAYNHPVGATYAGAARNEAIFSKELIRPGSVAGRQNEYILKYSGRTDRPVDVYVKTVGSNGEPVYRLLDVPEGALSFSFADISALQRAGERGKKFVSDLVPGKGSGSFNKITINGVVAESAVKQGLFGSVVESAVQAKGGSHVKVRTISQGSRAGETELYFELTKDELKKIDKILSTLHMPGGHVQEQQFQTFQNIIYEFNETVSQISKGTVTRYRMGAHELTEGNIHIHFEGNGQNYVLKVNLLGFGYGAEADNKLKTYLFKKLMRK